jgi:hypothetical protein
VPRDGSDIAVARDWNIFVFPEIASMKRFRSHNRAKLQVLPGHAHFSRLISTVEQAHGRRVLHAEAGSLTVS